MGPSKATPCVACQFFLAVERPESRNMHGIFWVREGTSHCRLYRFHRIVLSEFWSRTVGTLFPSDPERISLLSHPSFRDYRWPLDFLSLCSESPALSLSTCQKSMRCGCHGEGTICCQWWGVAVSIGLLGTCSIRCMVCFPTGRLCYYTSNCDVYYSEI